MSILIAGAGVGGLSTALSLHAAGFTDVTVLEAARSIEQVGVGINLPPHAVRELVELGLGDALARAGWPSAELSYYDRQGELIWAEERGLAAGYRWPQYSIHRGRLQQLLLDATRERLGDASVLTGRRVVGLVSAGDSVRITTLDADTGARAQHNGSLLVGADGIRSAVRAVLYENKLALATNGWTIFRGTTQAPPFLSGHTMVITGDESLRCVVYPLDAHTLNWLVARPSDAASAAGRDLGNWNRPVDPGFIAEFIADWNFDWLDMPAMVRGALTAYEYPMADIDPLPRWTFGRTTLLGDAAHAMYPFGSNGASQSIIDARILALELARHADVDAALAAYEVRRRPAVSAVQLANRQQAGDVMARVSAMARSRDHGGAAAQLREAEEKYKQLAGFDAQTLNTRASWSVVRGH